MYRTRADQHGVYKTAEAKVYEQEVWYITNKLKPLEGDIRLMLYFYFPRNNRDIDSGLKSILDCMQNKAYFNDKQITKLYVEKHVDKKNPRVEVEYEEVK